MTPVLLVTGFWPTADRPSTGIFVQRRTQGADVRVIAPSSYEGSMALRYLRLAWQAVTARGPFLGVEAHPLFPAGLIGLVAARLRGVPLVTYAHGADVRVTATENRLYRALARLVVRGSAAIVTNSSETADLVRGLGGAATIIPPGVDLTRFRPSPRPAERRVLYLGGDDPRKGIEVARELADTVLGPGIRTIEPDEVPAILRDHDVILMPSRAEPFGLVAAEAIAAGRWVVARAVGGLRDIVEDGVTGTLVQRDADFRAALAHVPDYDPDEVAARAARFSLEHANRAMDDLWRRVLAERPRRAGGRPGR